MTDKETAPRLSIQITPEQRSKLKRLIPWGAQSGIYQAVTDDLIELLENSDNGHVIIGAILQRKLLLTDWSKLHKKEKEKKNGN